ncbi:hypothetical protein F3B35_14125, partial [Bacteroides intestinalis]
VYSLRLFLSLKKISCISAELFHASMKVLHPICIIFATCTKLFQYETRITYYSRPHRCIRLRIWRTYHSE